MTCHQLYKAAKKTWFARGQKNKHESRNYYFSSNCNFESPKSRNIFHPINLYL